MILLLADLDLGQVLNSLLVCRTPRSLIT